MRQKKVLVVDDDRDVVIGLVARLESAGYEVEFASDALSAMSVAVRMRPDAILLDIGLPAGDGFVVLDRIKKNARLALTPVIILTAREGRRNEPRALQGGAFAFLRKPCPPERLLATIEAALLERGSEPPGAAPEAAGRRP